MRIVIPNRAGVSLEAGDEAIAAVSPARPPPMIVMSPAWLFALERRICLLPPIV
jgi:hypothetical protein